MGFDFNNSVYKAVADATVKVKVYTAAALVTAGASGYYYARNTSRDFALRNRAYQIEKVKQATDQARQIAENGLRRRQTISDSITEAEGQRQRQRFEQAATETMLRASEQQLRACGIKKSRILGQDPNILGSANFSSNDQETMKQYTQMITAKLDTCNAEIKSYSKILNDKKTNIGLYKHSLATIADSLSQCERAKGSNLEYNYPSLGTPQDIAGATRVETELAQHQTKAQSLLDQCKATTIHDNVARAPGAREMIVPRGPASYSGASASR